MLQLREIVKHADKLKCMNRFRQAYSSGVLPLNSAIFGELVRFFAAVVDGTEVGHIRICNYSSSFEGKSNDEVWSMSEAYVKPAHRHKGVLHDMITLAVRDHKVKMLYIEPQRLVRFSSYYRALGFSSCRSANDPTMVFAVLDSFRNEIRAANDEHYKQAA
jgi:hypothetical protein